MGWGNVNGAEYVLAEMQPARTSGGFSFVKRMNSAYTNGLTLAELLNSADQSSIRIQVTAANQLTLQYWSGAAWVSVGAAIGGLVSGITYRFIVDFSGLGTAAGSLKFKIVSEFTDALVGEQSGAGLNLTGATNAARPKIYGGLSTNDNNLFGPFLKDGSALAAYSHVNRPTSNGIDAADGSGSYADVDDIGGAPDTDFIALPAVGNKRSVKGAARALAGRTVKGVAVNARLSCGVSGPAQAKLYIVIGGVRYYHPTTLNLTTSKLPYSLTFELNPATGAPWLNAAAESAALEWGVEVA